MGREIHNIDGSDDSYKATNTMKPEKERLTNVSTADDEQASWVTLLGAIQREEADSREWEEAHRISPRGNKYDKPEYTICHSMQKKTRSYDFMPPAVTKPYATTTISHLVEMIGMLGMYWKAFEEIRGNLRAEGNGFILTSTTVHGLGLMATFSVTGLSKFKENRVIPSHDIKELVFGFVPSILGKSLEFGSADGVKRTLAVLKCEPDVSESYLNNKDRPYIFSVTFELVAMLTIPLRIRGSNLKMLPNPTGDKWLGPASIIKWTVEMLEFQAIFEDAAQSVTAPGAARHPLLLLIKSHWEKMRQVWTENCDIDMRETTHDAIDQITIPLQTRADFSLAEVTSVVASHVTAVLAATDGLQRHINRLGPDDRSKFIQYYVDEILPKVADDGLNLSEEAKSRRGVIWLALMFRMMCWFVLHDFDSLDVNMMPSDMKGSRMPVFIG